MDHRCVQKYMYKLVYDFELYSLYLNHKIHNMDPYIYLIYKITWKDSPN